MKLSDKKYIVFIILSLISQAAVFAQNVADSDLSNNAGTNKNFSEEWWLFGVIGLVVLMILLAYSRRRRKKI